MLKIEILLAVFAALLRVQAEGDLKAPAADGMQNCVMNMRLDGSCEGGPAMDAPPKHSIGRPNVVLDDTPAANGAPVATDGDNRTPPTTKVNSVISTITASADDTAIEAMKDDKIAEALAKHEDHREQPLERAPAGCKPRPGAHKGKQPGMGHANKDSNEFASFEVAQLDILRVTKLDSEHSRENHAGKMNKAALNGIGQRMKRSMSDGPNRRSQDRETDAGDADKSSRLARHMRKLNRTDGMGRVDRTDRTERTDGVCRVGRTDRTDRDDSNDDMNLKRRARIHSRRSRRDSEDGEEVDGATGSKFHNRNRNCNRKAEDNGPDDESGMKRRMQRRMQRRVSRNESDDESGKQRRMARRASRDESADDSEGSKRRTARRAARNEPESENENEGSKRRMERRTSRNESEDETFKERRAKRNDSEDSDGEDSWLRAHMKREEKEDGESGEGRQWSRKAEEDSTDTEDSRHGVARRHVRRQRSEEEPASSEDHSRPNLRRQSKTDDGATDDLDREAQQYLDTACGPVKALKSKQGGKDDNKNRLGKIVALRQANKAVDSAKVEN